MSKLDERYSGSRVEGERGAQKALHAEFPDRDKALSFAIRRVQTRWSKRQGSKLVARVWRFTYLNQEGEELAISVLVQIQGGNWVTKKAKVQKPLPEGKMNYVSKHFSRYCNPIKLEDAQRLYERLVELGIRKPWKETLKESAWDQWNDPERVGFYLMSSITGRRTEALPDEFIIEVGKAFGFNFEYGFWRFLTSKNADHEMVQHATDLLQEDYSLIYDPDFWAELSYFKPSQMGYVNRGDLLRKIGHEVSAISLWGGIGFLVDLPDGNCFFVSGGAIRQVKVGTLKGGRQHGWFIATEGGWKRYGGHLGAGAEKAIRWLVLDNDGTQVLSYYDLHGMDFNFQSKTVHTHGVPLPKFYGEITVDGEYADSITALVNHDGQLLGLALSVVNFNGEGIRFTPTTPAMQTAWQSSRIGEILEANLRVREEEK